MANVALINYYARLIKKGSWKIEDVPDDKRPAVEEALKSMKDIPFDPITQTPEEK